MIWLLLKKMLPRLGTILQYRDFSVNEYARNGTSCIRKEPSFIGMSGKETKAVNGQKFVKIWGFWKRIIWMCCRNKPRMKMMMMTGTHREGKSYEPLIKVRGRLSLHQIQDLCDVDNPEQYLNP